MTSTSSPESIPVFGATEAIEHLVAPSLASLPMTLHRTTDASGSIHLIDGRSSTWPLAVGAAMRSGAAAVFVLEPSVPELAALDETIRVAAAVPVGLDLAWAGNPALEALQLSESEPVRAVVANGSVGSACSEDLVSAAVDALVAVASAMGRAPALVRFTQAEWSASASGHWDDVVFRLSMVRSAAVGRSLEISAHGNRLTRMAQVPDPTTAAPAIITLIDADGTRLQPTVYETSRRAGLRRLADHVRRSEPTGDLARYREVIAALEPLQP